jgi:hypothetical protein
MELCIGEDRASETRKNVDGRWPGAVEKSQSYLETAYVWRDRLCDAHRIFGSRSIQRNNDRIVDHHGSYAPLSSSNREMLFFAAYAFSCFVILDAILGDAKCAEPMATAVAPASAYSIT